MLNKCLIVGFTIIGVGIIFHLIGVHHGIMRYHCHRKLRGLPDKIVGKISKECNLNETQKAGLADLKEAFLLEHQSAMEQHKGKFNLLITEIERDELDQDAFNRAFEEGLQKKQETHRKLVAQFAGFHASLRPEQKRKLAGLIRSHHDKMAKRFHHLH